MGKSTPDLHTTQKKRNAWVLLFCHAPIFYTNIVRIPGQSTAEQEGMYSDNLVSKRKKYSHYTDTNSYLVFHFLDWLLASDLPTFVVVVVVVGSIIKNFAQCRSLIIPPPRHSALSS